MGYTFIDHTADVAADLTGPTLPHLFLAGAQALTDTITALDRVRPAVTQFITLEAPSLEDLLVDWLNELLYRFEVQNMLFSDTSVPVEELGSQWLLQGEIAGELFDPARHPSRVLVKSATYHGLSVFYDDGLWRARIVFDI